MNICILRGPVKPRKFPFSQNQYTGVVTDNFGCVFDNKKAVMPLDIAQENRQRFAAVLHASQSPLHRTSEQACTYAVSKVLEIQVVQ
jgi:hypothetical protein